ncbi:hypothetical protein BH09PSE4_BH09PSE4_16260 [soil metagenome]
MYMAPIVAAKTSNPILRRLVGLPVLAVSAVVMLPWLAVYALWSAVALTVRSLPRLPRTVMTMVDYAGTVALGR